MIDATRTGAFLLAILIGAAVAGRGWLELKDWLKGQHARYRFDNHGPELGQKERTP